MRAEAPVLALAALGTSARPAACPGSSGAGRLFGSCVVTGRAAVGGCWGARGCRPSSRMGRCGSRCRSLWVGLPQPHSAGDGVACSQMCGRWAPRPPLLPP